MSPRPSPYHLPPSTAALPRQGPSSICIPQSAYHRCWRLSLLKCKSDYVLLLKTHCSLHTTLRLKSKFLTRHGVLHDFIPSFVSILWPCSLSLRHIGPLAVCQSCFLLRYCTLFPLLGSSAFRHLPGALPQLIQVSAQVSLPHRDFL